MRAYERFLQYVTIPTQSAEGRGVNPSTACQWKLLRQLAEEMRQLGLTDVSVSEFGVVMGHLPATQGLENAPAIGFLAHVDTAPDFSGDGVCPLLHPDYDGGDLSLPREGRVLRVSEFPALAGLRGRTLITADGATLLGADDKAGIAEIMTLCERLVASGAAHGKICVAFTPDEEIGEGPDHFDVAAFGAQYAYTVDGSAEGEIEYENFNAAAARISIKGVSVHPGSAKDVMENALLIAMEINSQLPPNEIPARTAGYEGFFHVTNLTGSAEEAALSYIIRDHSMEKFQQRKALLQDAVARAQAAHPRSSVSLELKDSYYNMAGQLKDCMHLIENARIAARAAGLKPVTMPIRGGTDGARLSFVGLPCPNLGTGGFNAHGPYECATVEGMDAVVDMLEQIVFLYAK